MAVAAALQIASLLARTEAWNISVHAAGGTVDRRPLYRAAGVGYLGNILNRELGFAARIASLRRAAPRETSKAVVLATTEIPIVLMEVTLATLFSFTLVASLSLPWWTPLVTFVRGSPRRCGARPAARRHRSGWWKGLAALGEARARTRVAIFVVLAVCGQIARNWLMLYASGIHASVFDATAVPIAVAALVWCRSPRRRCGGDGPDPRADWRSRRQRRRRAADRTGTVGALGYGDRALADRFWTKQRTRLRLGASGTARRATALT